MPAPGEMQLSSGNNPSSPGSRRRSFALGPASAHHHRQPSLGELHQELENEQEAQVNRLLQMIRVQQDQLANMQHQQQQQQQQHHHQGPAATVAEQTHSPAPTSTPASAVTNDHITSPQSATTASPSHYFNRPAPLSRQSSHRLNSRGTSPALHPQSGGLGPSNEEFTLSGNRDECAYYQAETQTLTRENQMLKLRIRELERQITDMSAPLGAPRGSAILAQNSSPLANQTATFAGESIPPVPAEVEPRTKIE